MMITEVSPQELQTCLQRGDAVMVVDLRHPMECNAGHIPGAMSLFIKEIPLRLRKAQDTDGFSQRRYGLRTPMRGGSFRVEYAIERHK